MKAPRSVFPTGNRNAFDDGDDRPLFLRNVVISRKVNADIMENSQSIRFRLRNQIFQSFLEFQCVFNLPELNGGSVGSN